MSENDASLDRQGFIQIGERFSQRISAKEWKRVLLKGDDRVVYAGRVRYLKGRSLGFGVVEVTMLPLEERQTP